MDDSINDLDKNIFIHTKTNISYVSLKDHIEYLNVLCYYLQRKISQANLGLKVLFDDVLNAQNDYRHLKYIINEIIESLKIEQEQEISKTLKELKEQISCGAIDFKRILQNINEIEKLKKNLSQEIISTDTKIQLRKVDVIYKTTQKS